MKIFFFVDHTEKYYTDMDMDTEMNEMNEMNNERYYTSPSLSYLTSTTLSTTTHYYTTPPNKTRSTDIVLRLRAQVYVICHHVHTPYYPSGEEEEEESPIVGHEGYVDVEMCILRQFVDMVNARRYSPNGKKKGGGGVEELGQFVSLKVCRSSASSSSGSGGYITGNQGSKGTTWYAIYTPTSSGPTHSSSSSSDNISVGNNTGEENEGIRMFKHLRDVIDHLYHLYHHIYSEPSDDQGDECDEDGEDITCLIQRYILPLLSTQGTTQKTQTTQNNRFVCALRLIQRYLNTTTIEKNGKHKNGMGGYIGKSKSKSKSNMGIVRDAHLNGVSSYIHSLTSPSTKNREMTRLARIARVVKETCPLLLSLNE